VAGKGGGPFFSFALAEDGAGSGKEACFSSFFGSGSGEGEAGADLAAGTGTGFFFSSG